MNFNLRSGDFSWEMKLFLWWEHSVMETLLTFPANSYAKNSTVNHIFGNIHWMEIRYIISNNMFIHKIICLKTQNWIIVCPLNNNCNLINQDVLWLLSGDLKQHCNVDLIITNDVERVSKAKIYSLSETFISKHEQTSISLIFTKCNIFLQAVLL